ncbi:MAG: hypothetical protein AAF667_13215 [Pseudomonadota bacterium]
MIGPADLRAAVGAGLLSEAQAAGLSSLAARRRGALESLSSHDEPFELFRGFNEVFIVVGLIILTSGWTGLIGAAALAGGSGVISTLVSFAAVGAVLLWILSEYFVRRRRMVAPAIALTVLWAGNAASGIFAQFSDIWMAVQANYESLTLPMFLTTGAIFLHWLRFRVPFSMAMIALGLFLTALIYAADRAGSPDDLSELFLLSAGGPFAWITLALGALVFVAAMFFDMSDPHRVSRRSANGFWLHIVAAPALVNTIALSLLTHETAAANLALGAVLALIAIVAIVIDRRSFLIAGAGYSVVLAATLSDGSGAATAILTLGAALLLLGSFWERIRSRILGAISELLPLDRLPPSA